MSPKEMGMNLWIGLNRLRVGYSGTYLCTRYRTASELSNCQFLKRDRLLGVNYGLTTTPKYTDLPHKAIKVNSNYACHL